MLAPKGMGLPRIGTPYAHVDSSCKGCKAIERSGSLRGTAVVLGISSCTVAAHDNACLLRVLKIEAMFSTPDGGSCLDCCTNGMYLLTLGAPVDVRRPPIAGLPLALCLPTLANLWPLIVRTNPSMVRGTILSLSITGAGQTQTQCM